VIYEFPDPNAPVRQGDVFIGLPRIEISLKNLTILSEDHATEVVPWSNIVEEGRDVSAILGIRPVAAIVATQDCDTLHSPDITLCEIRDFQDVDRSTKSCVSAKSWMNAITQQARKNLKWFYLPPDARIGFTKRMAVDFLVTIRIAREDLWEHRSLRKGRLIPEADEHFRERLAEFFRRYPYDEWYPLEKAEFAEYRRSYPDIEPREWQKQTPTPSAPTTAD
jgi:hypothetical protein